MKQPRLPLTVIGGYLGAGKTTLINRLLSEDHGQKLMVMVNDFGSINIDAALLESASDDTITLTNGCVCCTMGADLFMAMNDVLDRRPRPDHLLIEASGIADPARIAAAARAEPDMAYGGTIVVVDALNFETLADDPQIGAQVRDQVAAADLVLVGKSTGIPAKLAVQLSVLGPAPLVDLSTLDEVAPILLGGMSPRNAPAKTDAHPAYTHWVHDSDITMRRENLVVKLNSAPAALYRLKGWVRDPEGNGFEVHKVGARQDVKKVKNLEATRLVGIGVKAALDLADVQDWWNS